MKLIFGFLMCCFWTVSFGQIFKKDTSDLTFTGTKINPYSQEFDSTGKIHVSGYVDTYYSYYSDTLSADGYAKFPTSAARNNQIGLNIIQLSAKYQSKKMRGVVTLFYGDVPLSAWSARLNLIQEANVGFNIYKKLWIDAGYFRTHIGLESIQPRENITSSFATTTYFEPYFLSGAKLTWQESEKWTFQTAIFNGFNTFIETNNNKAFSASIAFIPSSKWSHSLTSMVSDEYPKGSSQTHYRVYTNYVGVFKTSRVTLGLEGNFGTQQHSQLKDSTKTAIIYSGIIALKYRLTPKHGVYSRLELFSDLDEVLTGPIQNDNHTLTGLDIFGVTLGYEFKPIPNAFFRIESRYLNTKSDEKIFYHNKQSTHIRWEGIASIGLWF